MHSEDVAAYSRIFNRIIQPITDRELRMRLSDRFDCSLETGKPDLVRRALRAISEAVDLEGQPPDTRPDHSPLVTGEGVTSVEPVTLSARP